MRRSYLFGQLIFCFLLVLFFGSSCKKEKDTTYGVNALELQPATSGKAKLKTNDQYLAILHANLFQKALSANQIFDLARCMETIGDQELAREVIISNFFNDPTVILPTHKSMWQDMDKFIIDTYKRFLVRNPSQAEKTYLKNFITKNSDVNDSTRVSPEIVYFSFALSNEYMYY